MSELRATDGGASVPPHVAAFMRDWLGNCIRRLETMEPTPRRDAMLRTLNGSLERYQPTSNVIEFPRRAA